MASHGKKSGRKKEMTNLQLRRKLWDSMNENEKLRTKRPGSNKK